MKRLDMFSSALITGLLIFSGHTGSVWGRELSALEKNVVPGVALAEINGTKSLNVSACPGEFVYLHFLKGYH